MLLRIENVDYPSGLLSFVEDTRMYLKGTYYPPIFQAASNPVPEAAAVATVKEVTKPSSVWGTKRAFSDVVTSSIRVDSVMSSALPPNSQMASGGALSSKPTSQNSISARGSRKPRKPAEGKKR